MRFNRVKTAVEGLMKRLWLLAMLSPVTAWAADESASTYSEPFRARHGVVPMDQRMTIAVFIFVSVLLVFMIYRTISRLQQSKHWDLGLALSESIRAPGESKSLGMVPSSSRLIAYFGLMAIIAIYIGIGYCLMWRIASGGSIGDINGIIYFFMGGATVFAPYIMNQIKDSVHAFALGRGRRGPSK